MKDDGKGVRPRHHPKRYEYSRPAVAEGCEWEIEHPPPQSSYLPLTLAVHELRKKNWLALNISVQ